MLMSSRRMKLALSKANILTFSTTPASGSLPAKRMAHRASCRAIICKCSDRCTLACTTSHKLRSPFSSSTYISMIRLTYRLVVILHAFSRSPPSVMRRPASLIQWLCVDCRRYLEPIVSRREALDNTTAAQYALLRIAEKAPLIYDQPMD